MDSELQIRKRLASLGGEQALVAYIAALERAVGGIKEPVPLPKNLTGKDRQLLSVLGSNCATAAQLAGVTHRSRRGLKDRLNRLCEMGVLERKMGLRGGYVYWASKGTS